MTIPSQKSPSEINKLLEAAKEEEQTSKNTAHWIRTQSARTDRNLGAPCAQSHPTIAIRTIPSHSQNEKLLLKWALTFLWSFEGLL